MAGTCQQDPDLWCPLSTDKCKNLRKPCVLLTAGLGGTEILRTMALLRKVKEEKIGPEKVQE